MSLEFNPLAAMGFGLEVEGQQSWNNVIENIKIQCGAIGQFEYSDEAIIKLLKTQVMPFYSVYDSYPVYQRMTTADILSDFPTRVYKLHDTATKIISVRNIISSEYMHLGNLVENSLFGFGGHSIEDYLISRNYSDMQKSIIPVRTWKYIPPNRIEFIQLATISDDYDFIIELNTVHPDPSSINPTMYDKFMDMAVGYMKLSVGTIRSQITSLSTPTGTIEITPDQLKQEGQDLLLRVKEALKMTPPDKLLYLL